MAEDTTNPVENEESKPEAGAANPPAENDAPTLPQTQEELDAIIEARVARERRNAAKKTKGAAAEQPTAAQPEAPADNSAAQLEQVQAQLWEAKAQAGAMQLGIKPEVAQDAAYLALRQATAKDELDEAGIKDALSDLLKRHPEWKTASSSGFRQKVGADGTGQENKQADLDELFDLPKG